MKYCGECIESDFIVWKYKYANCIWEINGMNYKPTVCIEKTSKFSVLYII